MREIRWGVRLVSVPPRAPTATVLAASPKQTPAALEDVRQRLAAAWSTSPFPDIDAFVLNSRARDPNLRRMAPALVMRVARSMDLDFGASAVAKAAALREAWSETDVSAPEQAQRANAMLSAALDEFGRLQALKRLR